MSHEFVARVRHAALPLALAGLVVVAPAPLAAQAAQAAAATAASDTTAARPQDVQSPDAILAALYDVISGGAGVKRDWNRFRSLMLPGARLIPTGVRQDGSRVARVMTPDDYVRTSGAQLERNGFFEREIGRKEERFGNVLHAFSAYESKRTASDPTPFARGINSIQLFHDGKRWWVASIMWDQERADNQIPHSMLKH